MACGLVIFDCDGVLVDTEAVSNHTLVRILAEAGFSIDYENCRRRFVGRTIEAVQETVEREGGVPLGASWPDKVRAETAQAFEAGIEPIAGARTAVQGVRAADIPFCVASSGRFAKMRASLGKTGLLPLVADVLFSAEQVARGKPAPDLFLFAARSMGIPPADATVIEDSVPGVLAGKAAGMRVLGYAGDPLTDAEGLRAAGAELFDDMARVPALV